MAVWQLVVNIDWGAGHKHGVNVWHFRQTSLPTFPLPPIPTLIKNWYDAIKGFPPSSCVFSFDGIVRDVSSAEPTDPPVLQPWTVQCNGGTNTAPNGVGLVVGWKSSLATRRGRGRTFIAPVSQAMFDGPDGTLDNTKLTALNTMTNTLVSGSTADGNGAIVVWSPTDHLGRDVVAFKINDKPAWLSSRRG